MQNLFAMKGRGYLWNFDMGVAYTDEGWFVEGVWDHIRHLQILLNGVIFYSPTMWKQ